MQDHSRQPSPEETALRQAVRHPKRLEMLSYLTGRRIGTGEVELANALDLSLPLTKYHLKVLQGAKLVARVEDSETADRYVAAATGL